MTDDLHHLGAAYVLDALDPDERRDFEAHYPSCGICSAEVQEFRETARRLAAGVAAEPPAALRARVLAEIGRTRQLSPNQPAPQDELAARRGNRVALLAAAALIAVAAGVAGLMLGGTSTSGVEQVLGADDVTYVTLEGDRGSLVVAWSPERDQVALLGSGLPVPQTGRVYQLWFLQPDGVAPAGVFEVASGSLHTSFGIDDEVPLGWGISIEPAGGSPQPTSEVIFAGEI